MNKVGSILGVAVLAWAAGAEGAGATSPWQIEHTPECAPAVVSRLKSEIALACDAAGTRCVISADAHARQRQLRLSCDGAGASEERGWTLEARDVDGEVLWSLSLDGAEDDRFRNAAFAVARMNATDDGPTSPVSKGLPDDDDVPEHAPYTHGFSLALRGAGLSGASAIPFGPMLGIHAAATLVSVRSVRFGLAGAVESSVGWDNRAVGLGRAGALLALGAPGSDGVFGLTVEAGGVVGTRRHFSTITLASYVTPIASPYAEVGLIVQSPWRGPLRPYAGMALNVFANGQSEVAAEGALDIGVAWNLW